MSPPYARAHGGCSGGAGPGAMPGLARRLGHYSQPAAPRHHPTPALRYILAYCLVYHMIYDMAYSITCQG